MIYVGIDDTDIIGSPGTNQLARAVVRRLRRVAKGAIVSRHQLLVDPRIPYTSQNGSASIQLPHGHEIPRAELVAILREEMLASFVEGSDPGLAVANDVSGEMRAFAGRAKTALVSQTDARMVAECSGCHLEELGGTGQGIIGALAAIGLAITGDDGRIVHLDGWPWPDPFSGLQRVSAIHARGVAEIRTRSGEPFRGDVVDVGKHLRPNWRDGRIVLVVESRADGEAVRRAIKLN